MARSVDILMVSPTTSGMGGIARHVTGLVSRLLQAGYDVAQISSENTPVIGVKSFKNTSFMFTSSIKASVHHARVVHAHNLPSAPAMKTAKADKRILTLHGVYAEQIGLLHGTMLGKTASLFEKLFLRWADTVTTVSLAAAEIYRGTGFKTVYIPNAVDVDVKADPIRHGSPQVVYVGRLSKEKNVEALVEAANRLPNVKFVIVGDGPELFKLKKLSKHLQNIVFTGAVSHDKALGYIAGSDVLVLPSLAEGLSTTVLEAMALKTPVVATSVGGNTELLENRVSGLLIRPGDVEAIVEGILFVLENKKTVNRIVENAYRRVVENFSWEVVFPKYLEVYGFE